jgi:predicted Zn-dependent protease
VTGPAIEVAERVLELVRERAAGAEAEVNVRTGTSALTRFANSFIHQNVAEEISHVALRVANDGRVASTSFDGTPDDEALARVVQNALDAARVRPPDPDWPGLAPSADTPDPNHWDDATAAAGPDERAQRVADFVAASDGLETAGACRSEAVTAAFANSAGQRAEGRATAADIDGIARTGSSDGSARMASVRLADLDGRDAGERAARKARDGADPTDLEPGRYEVVLEPQCVTDILLFLTVYGFNGRAVEEGRSFIRPGEQQFDPAFTLRDDPSDPVQIGVGFDAEGTPKRPFDLVRDGVTCAAIHTRRTAAKAGTESTGHAVEGAEAFGALPLNLVVSAGDRSTDDLIASVERGLLVTDFWYTRILDPRTQVVTGLTRNGVWLVEDGRIARPVSNLRFTQSFVEALAPGAIRGISSNRRLLYDEFGSASFVPALHLASWNFTGGAKG